MSLNHSRRKHCRCKDDAYPHRKKQTSQVDAVCKVFVQSDSCPSRGTRDHTFLSFRAASAKIALRSMKETEQENQHTPLSYHGAWRIVWLVFLLIILWLIL